MKQVNLLDEGFPHLVLFEDGSVLNTINNKYLTINDGKFQTWKDGKNNRRSVSKLLRKYFINNNVEMKDIPGYEGIYSATEDGQIYSCFNQKFLSPSSDGRYLGVTLSKDSVKIHHLVHRLIAQTWIPNPENLPQVNHKDENKENNHIDNLEWCDAKYNINYGDRTERMIQTRLERHGY